MSDVFNFQESLLVRETIRQVKAQRDPRTYLGLERMFLQWMSLMIFALTVSLSLSTIPGTLSRIFQFVWLPFAAAGVVFSVWRYYSRVAAMQDVVRRAGVRVGSDPLAYLSFSAVLIGILVSTVAVVFVTYRNRL